MRNAGDGISELDADALVVRPLVVERALEVLPELLGDIERARHRRLALRRGRAHELGVFRIHLRDRARAARGEMPREHEGNEDRDGDDRRAPREREVHVSERVMTPS